MRGVVVTLLLVGACGRSGFELEPDAAPSMNRGDGAAADAPAGSVVGTFGETPTATITGVTADTFLDSEIGFTADNFGASTSMPAESAQKRALLKFTLTSIPVGATIIAAHLNLYSSASFAGSGTIHPVLESWTEGSGTGQAGVANWTMRTASSAWATVGAGTPGSSGAQIATFTTPGLGVFGVDLPVTVVQGWVDAPSSNFGVMLQAAGSNTDLSFASSNSTTATNRPELVVTYLP